MTEQPMIIDLGFFVANTNYVVQSLKLSLYTMTREKLNGKLSYTMKMARGYSPYFKWVFHDKTLLKVALERN